MNFPPARPATQNSSVPRQHLPLYEDEEIEEEETGEAAKTTKRRKKPSKAKKGRATKKPVDSQGEFFDLDGQSGANADDNDEEPEGEAILDCRLSYYQGELKKLLVRAIFFMRLFLLCTEGFPSKEALIKWAEKSFAASCQIAYGINFKGLRFFSRFVAVILRIVDRMPEFTDGMSTLVSG